MPAVGHLLSIGADVNVRWEHGINSNLESIVIMDKLQRARFKRLTLNLFTGNKATDAWVGGRLPLLHLAVSPSVLQLPQNTALRPSMHACMYACPPALRTQSVLACTQQCSSSSTCPCMRMTPGAHGCRR